MVSLTYATFTYNWQHLYPHPAADMGRHYSSKHDDMVPMAINIVLIRSLDTYMVITGLNAVSKSQTLLFMWHIDFGPGLTYASVIACEAHL